MEGDVEIDVWGMAMIERSGFRAALLLAAILASAPSKLYASQVLITEAEAQLPPQKAATAIDRRGITRGPKIELIPQSDPVHSPMHLRLKFETFGGSRIDINSVKVSYIKNPTVDLTPRLKDFVQPSGIDMPDVQLPVGDHMIRVELKDSEGRPGISNFVLKIAP